MLQEDTVLCASKSVEKNMYSINIIFCSVYEYLKLTPPFLYSKV